MTTTPTPPRVVGLDLSMTATGIAATDATLSTLHPKGIGDARLDEISDGITDTVFDATGIGGADLVVVEDLPTHAHAAGTLGMVHGVVRLLLVRGGVPYTVVPPASLKKYAAGRGNATKADMRMALYQRAGLDVRDDNQVDAAWLRAMGLDALGHPPVKLPADQRAALGKVAWPTTDLPEVA